MIAAHPGWLHERGGEDDAQHVRGVGVPVADADVIVPGGLAGGDLGIAHLVQHQLQASLPGSGLYLLPQRQFRRRRARTDQHDGAQPLAVPGAVAFAVAVGPASLVEQPCGAGRVVVLAALEVTAVERRGQTQRATGARELAEVHTLQCTLDISAANEGLAYTDVIEWRTAQVEGAIGGVARALGDDQFQVRVAPCCFVRLWRQCFDHIDLTGLQRGEAHRRLLDELPDDAFQVRRALMPCGRWRPVVGRVAHQFHLVLPVPAHHLERPAADRAFAVLVTAA